METNDARQNQSRPERDVEMFNANVLGLDFNRLDRVHISLLFRQNSATYRFSSRRKAQGQLEAAIGISQDTADQLVRVVQNPGAADLPDHDLGFGHGLA